MRFSLASLVRLIAFVTLALSAVAVGVSRAVPPVRPLRMLATPRHFGLYGSSFTPPLAQNFMLDGGSGEVRLGREKEGESFELVSSVPWSDERGEQDLLGRLTVRSGSSMGALCVGTVLARFAEGETEPRSTVAVRPVIAGRPCWFGSHPSRVVFPAGDGGLYTADLRPGDGSSFATADTGDEAPCRPIVWGTVAPGIGLPLMNDPVCPAVPAMKNRVIVTLCPGWTRGSKGGFGASELWWLQLGPDDATVTAAGRLTVPDPSRPVVPEAESRQFDDDERLANVAVLPDGRVVIAYLARPPRVVNWSLRVAPVHFDRDGVPSVRAVESTEVGRDVAVGFPPISPDGRSVYRVSRVPVQGRPVVDRVDIVGAIGPETAGPERVVAQGRP